MYCPEAVLRDILSNEPPRSKLRGIKYFIHSPLSRRDIPSLASDRGEITCHRIQSALFLLPLFREEREARRVSSGGAVDVYDFRPRRKRRGILLINTDNDIRVSSFKITEQARNAI